MIEWIYDRVSAQIHDIILGYFIAARGTKLIAESPIST
jgi:hypothetical protein